MKPPVVNETTDSASSPKKKLAKKAPPSLKTSPGRMKSNNSTRIYVTAFKIQTVEAVWMEKSNGNDAYVNPLVRVLQQDDESDMISSSHLYDTFFRRQSLEDNQPLVNNNNTYYRRCFVNYLPDDKESTAQTRQDLMQLVKEVNIMEKQICTL